jgi:hypothetical protein
VKRSRLGASMPGPLCCFLDAQPHALLISAHQSASARSAPMSCCESPAAEMAASTWSESSFFCRTAAHSTHIRHVGRVQET